MAEEQMQSMEENRTQETQAQTEKSQEPQVQAQEEPADTTDWKAEARKWEARAKENKAKADAYDKAEEEAKSDLQKATERAERVQAELDALRAEQAHAVEVKAAAIKYGVDEDTLARMSGDVEENAIFLQAKKPKNPAYPQVNDKGEVNIPPLTKEDIEKEPDEYTRVMKRANNISLYR